MTLLRRRRLNKFDALGLIMHAQLTALDQMEFEAFGLLQGCFDLVMEEIREGFKETI